MNASRPDIADAPSLVGRALGDYRIRQELGGGKLSQVFLAVGSGPSATVAIKVFSASVARNRQAMQYLQHALRIVARLEHPGIPRILGSGLIAGRPYIVMPFFDSGSLRDRLEMGLLSLADLPDALDEIAPTLSYAHSKGVAHGDLKPSEILLDSEGQMQLIGLGQTLPRSADDTSGVAPSDDIYRAPEIMRGEPPTPSADQYSLAMIALEMATGYDPRDAVRLLHSPHADRPSHAIRQDSARSYLPPRMVGVLSRAMADDPSQRFPSVSGMQAALQAALHDTPVPAAQPQAETQTKQPRRRKRSFTLPLLATGLAAALCLLTTIPATSSSSFRGFDLRRYAGALVDTLSGQDAPAGVLVPSLPPPTSGPDLIGSRTPTEDSAAALADDGETASAGPSQPPIAGGDTPAEVDQPTEPDDNPDADRRAPTDEPDPTLPAGPTSTPTPAPTATLAPTSEPTATPVTVQPTDVPPTEPGEEPTINPNKCKTDPSHRNYCTPVP